MTHKSALGLTSLAALLFSDSSREPKKLLTTSLRSLGVYGLTLLFSALQILHRKKPHGALLGFQAGKGHFVLQERIWCPTDLDIILC